MLINAKPAQVEQPLEGLNMLDKGQGLPQGKPFSQLFASMINQPGKQIANSDKMAEEQTIGTANDLPVSVIDVSALLEGKTIPASQVDNAEPSEAFASMRLDVANLDVPNIDKDSVNLPGLVNSNIDAASELSADNNLDIVVQSNTESVDMVVNDGEAPEQNNVLNLAGYQEVDSVDNPILSQSQEFGYSVSDASIDESANNVANVTMPSEATQETVDKSVDETTSPESIQANNLATDSLQKSAVASSSQNVTGMASNVSHAGATVTANQQVVNQQSGVQQPGSQTSSAAHWGASSSDGSQSSGFAQGGQSGSQSNGQQSAQPGTQPNAQPYIANAIQSSQFQEKRAQNIEQQMAVKATDELIVKADSKESLLAIDGLSGDKKTFLPPGMQSIPVPVRSPQWGQAFGQRVVYMANNKLQQAQITLNPEKLGPVQVKLHIDKDQQVHVSMNAQHLTTREAMENAIPRLREMLEQAGIDLASVDVGEQSNFANNSDGESGSENNANSSAMSADSDGVEQSLTKTTIMSDNIVDFYA
ncbi:flagellar hook-length control protein FliK [Thiomicrorhabdus sp.]|uniref:flagellar hook-length control protein FliK n=1 Tax=Thiomicrorhabdus sp. TaxID=2039724 RepID=UPI002AA698FE|nr:flagellar hook-length control protein FliK [Thiomicrorhabdus sp.]